MLNVVILEGQSDAKCSMVFFLGGVTFTEIAALRLIARQLDRKIVIATTNLVNGNAIVQAAELGQMIGKSNGM